MSSTNVPVTQAPPEPDSSTAASGLPSDPAQAPTGTPPDQAGAPSEPDQLAAAAVELAREAAMEIAEPNTVGEHLGVTMDDGGLTMHSFRCTARGYRGWRWAVTLAHVPGTDRVTVCDTVLLPGADSIQAPAWVPWSDRLAPGDLGAGDDLPYRADDPLLVPGYTVTDENDADQQLFWELGLGRERVVGREGLQAAAERWERGPHGPTSELAIQASAACLSCAYLLPVSGMLRGRFGVCTNEWSPADGSVVTMDFGCGAHSETDLELPAPEPLPAHILDETIIEQVFVDRDEEPDGSMGLETGAGDLARADVEGGSEEPFRDAEGGPSGPFPEQDDDDAATLDPAAGLAEPDPDLAEPLAGAGPEVAGPDAGSGSDLGDDDARPGLDLVEEAAEPVAEVTVEPVVDVVEVDEAPPAP